MGELLVCLITLIVSFKMSVLMSMGGKIKVDEEQWKNEKKYIRQKMVDKMGKMDNASRS